MKLPGCSKVLTVTSSTNFRISGFLYGIGMYRPISNNIHLIGDNLGVLFCLKRGSSRNLFANEILKSLAYFRLNSPFFLNVSYIKAADNPADFYTRYI